MAPNLQEYLGLTFRSTFFRTEIVEIELDVLRNNILRFELLLSISGFTVTLGALVTGEIQRTRDVLSCGILTFFFVKNAQRSHDNEHARDVECCESSVSTFSVPTLTPSSLCIDK